MRPQAPEHPAGGGVDESDYVNGHATSTPSGDTSETQMLKYALGEENAYRTPVSGTKGATGHCLGAAGASGGTADEDEMCVLAGIQAAELQYKI